MTFLDMEVDNHLSGQPWRSMSPFLITYAIVYISYIIIYQKGIICSELIKGTPQ